MVLTGQQHQSNILVQYKENQNIRSTTPIRLNLAISIGWSGVETETHFFKMAASFFQRKRTLITTMSAKTKHLPSSQHPLFSFHTTFIRKKGQQWWKMTPCSGTVWKYCAMTNAEGVTTQKHSKNNDGATKISNCATKISWKPCSTELQQVIIMYEYLKRELVKTLMMIFDL